VSLQSIASKQNYKRLIVLFALLGIIILAAALRFYRIGEKTIWLDEGFSIWMGNHSLSDVIRWSVDIDQHPPLYHLLLSIWMKIGGSGAAWVRSFSALAGVLTIPVIYLIGKRLSDEVTGLLAAFVLAVNPFQVVYGQEGRVYALMTLNATLSLYMVIRLLTDPRTARQPIGSQLRTWWKTRSKTSRPGLQLDLISTDLTWLGYMIFTAGTVYCHNTAVFFPLGINLFVIGLMVWRRYFPAEGKDLQPPTFKNWIWAQIGAALFWSPWLAGFIIQAAGVLGEFWIHKPNMQMVVSTWQSFFGHSLPDRFTLGGWIWWFFLFIIGLGFYSYRKSLGKAFFLSTIFLTPFLGELLVSIWRPIFYVKTLIYTPISLYVLMAAGIRQLRFRIPMFAAFAVILFVSGASLRDFYNNYQKEAWDEAAAFVAKNGTAGDIILFNAGWTQIPFDYYFDGYKKPWEEFGAPQTMFEFGVLEPIMGETDLPRLKSILQGRERVWLVYSHYWYTDPDGLVIGTLRNEFNLIQQAHLYGIDIYLFGTR
jgi:mannosyltransferase